MDSASTYFRLIKSIRTGTPRTIQRRQADGGFTLVEMMMAAVIGSIIMAAVLTTYIMCVRGFTAISNYWEIHTYGRYSIDKFAGDMRGVSGITSFATNGPVVVVIPMTFDSSGNVTSSKTVTYTYAAKALKRTDSTIGYAHTIATNVYSVSFKLFDRVGNVTTVTSNAKAIQLELFLRKSTGSQKQTEDYLSARLDMRNTP